jgi:hypothetical protein
VADADVLLDEEDPEAVTLVLLDCEPVAEIERDPDAPLAVELPELPELPLEGAVLEETLPPPL